MVQDTLGRLLRDLRVSVTDRCNFRCFYCMPAEVYGDRYEFLPKEEVLTFEEIARLAHIFARLGTTKIRLTGGEPLVRRDLEKLVAMLAGIPGVEDLALTTNGFLLAQQAQALKEAGLKRVTVSLDSLDNTIFGQMNGRGFTTERVLQGIQKAQEVGLAPIKVNAVVVRGVNDHTVVDLARHFKGTGIVVRFIEYMDAGTRNGWRPEQVVPGQDVIGRISAVMPLEPIAPAYPGEVANRYRYKDGSGEVGIITAVSAPFCGDCTRARLSTEGKLYTCLFAFQGHDLRGPLRAGASDEQLASLIVGTWRARSDRYSELRAMQAAAGARKIEMYQIGG
ncbi:MAG: GTP 3',8-cyclase MoaA [Chloroflexi bacterium]|nr:GTP 3',8-cyclase MoaA [Chloroflexota bacterium]